MSAHSEKLLSDAGILQLKDASVVIAYTEWNDFVVSELVNGCEEKLKEYGLKHIKKIEVPGAVELPFACKRYYECSKDNPVSPDAIIMLGCVVRGGTPHFDYVCKVVTEGVLQLNLQLPIPVIFGILTVDNIEQAKDRSGGAHGHKGEEAAITALKMIAFNQSLPS